MKLIIAGSRTIEDYEHFQSLMDDYLRFFEMHSQEPVDEIISGACPTGVDAMGERWATEQGIPVKRFPADWKSHGKAAGPIRNAQMAEYADALFLMWDGKSRGSSSMLAEMEKLNKHTISAIVRSK